MRKIVITGASKGIGRAIAEKFLFHGFEVAVCARKISELESMAAEVKALNVTGKLHTAVCDVTDKAQFPAQRSGSQKIACRERLIEHSDRRCFRIIRRTETSPVGNPDSHCFKIIRCDRPQWQMHFILEFRRGRLPHNFHIGVPLVAR